MYDLLILIFEFLLFYIIYYFVLNNTRVQKAIYKLDNFKALIFVVLLIQFISIFLIRFDVTDVFLNSDAGKYFLQGIDIYWIDSIHMTYPFFPFLIYLHALLVFIWQYFQFLSFNFYLKIVLLGFLHLLGFLLYKQWKLIDLKTAKLKLLIFLLSPITYFVVLYHGQVDIILITFLYLSIHFFIKETQVKKNALNKSKIFLNFLTTTILYTASIASKTWSVIVLPIFALPVLQKTTIKNLIKFLTFLFLVIVFLLINIKTYTMFVFGGSIKTVLEAVIHPGGPTGVWGFGLILRLFNQEESALLFKLPIISFAIFWGYIYYQVKFLKRNFNYYYLVLLSILVFYFSAPRWGIQYIFWHWPFILLFINIDLLKNWVYQFIVPIYLFLNYSTITMQQEIIPNWITWSLGLIVYFYLLKLTISFLKTKHVKLASHL